MSTAEVAAPPSSETRMARARRGLSGPRRWDTIRNKLLGLWAGLALLYLFLPIFIVILFSFNDNRGRFNLTWQGFTLSHWEHPFAVPGLGAAMGKSLEIALISTTLAVLLGTFMALALVRYGFRGRRATDMFVFLPLATPEVVLGAALLGLFLTMNVDTGFATIVIAHTMFNVSYVVVTVKARLEGMDLHIEEAAMDLGANEWTTFRKITLPLIAPGVAAAALLAFALSIDDFVITNFNAGQTVTFPLFIYGAARQGIPPQVNVLATMLLLAALVLMAVNLVVQRRRAAVDARVPVAVGSPAAG
ncbi:MAG: spermidine/putrescine transport system permease protein [Thermoleophilaceae bacterium]|nr:spermidine/putrescine transport system permease protein [Thermoleophilaceae bacterium]